ncbi:STAS-like domain-containing protein [Candidatus Woesearchaeota archaeon]|nr:STAS-like domain-containing protein [Candidatus Woesearchaeota archaeon]
MIEIKIITVTGSFAENKDLARDIRLTKIVPALEKDQEIIIDFEGVEGATQSFIHALISEVIRKYGPGVLDKISFKNCNEIVRKIIGIVVDYMQESD